jgi:cobalamin synthase
VVAAVLLVIAAAGSRAFAVGVAFAARRRAVGEGMGARFAASVTATAVVVAGGTAAVLGVAAALVAGPIALLALVGGTAVAAVFVVLVIRARHQLDGDGLGAAVELAFSAVLLAGVVIASVTRA